MSNLITIRRGGVRKRIPKAQWESMLKGNATYGWEISTELPAEIAEVEEKIISETGVTQTPEPEDVKSAETAELEPRTLLDSGIRAIKDELPNLNAEDLNALLDAEQNAEEPRKSLIDLIEKQIKKLS